MPSAYIWPREQHAASEPLVAASVRAQISTSARPCTSRRLLPEPPRLLCGRNVEIVDMIGGRSSAAAAAAAAGAAADDDEPAAAELDGPG